MKKLLTTELISFNNFFKFCENNYFTNDTKEGNVIFFKTTDQKDNKNFDIIEYIIIDEYEGTVVAHEFCEEINLRIRHNLIDVKNGITRIAASEKFSFSVGSNLIISEVFDD